jgi:hypothetical protein
VLWLGSNDCRISNEYEEGVEIEKYIENLATMIKYLTRRGIIVILITPPPLAMKNPQDPQIKRYKDDAVYEIRKADRTAQFAKAALDLGESFKLPVCNCEHELQKAASLRDGGLSSLYEDGKWYPDYGRGICLPTTV